MTSSRSFRANRSTGVAEAMNPVRGYRSVSTLSRSLSHNTTAMHCIAKEFNPRTIIGNTYAIYGEHKYEIVWPNVWRRNEKKI